MIEHRIRRIEVSSPADFQGRKLEDDSDAKAGAICAILSPL